jgi:Polysaccharide lyase
VKLNLTVSVVVALLLFSVVISHAQDAPALLDVYDGFESPALSNVWSTDRFAPGAVQMQTNIFRAGHSAIQITVHSNDKFEAGINGNKNSERAELLEAPKLTSKENEPYEFSFSMFFPKDFPIVPTRLVIAQWKQNCPKGGNCSDDSPVLAIRYIAGVLKITQDLGKQRTTLYEQPGEFRNRWLDFKFQVRFATNETGRIKAWLGDQQLVDYQGITANPENTVTSYPSPSRFYFKMGLYRDVLPEPMTSYIDEYRKKQLPQNSFDSH